MMNAEAGVVEGAPGIIETTGIDPLDPNSNKGMSFGFDFLLLHDKLTVSMKTRSTPDPPSRVPSPPVMRPLRPT
jgi:hypothetical protein